MHEKLHQSLQSDEPIASLGMSTLQRKIAATFGVIAVLGIVIALLLPVQRSAPGAGRRSHCMNNLRQIALALLNYHDVYDSLPPAYTTNAEGKPLHSWRTLILPFLEQQALYEKIDLSKPWNDPVNKEASETKLTIYHCPSVQGPTNLTTYLAVVAPHSCFPHSTARKLSEITDDQQRTLMVVDVDEEHRVPWMSPEDASEDLILELVKKQNKQHFGVTLGTCVAGNIISLRTSLKESNWRAMITIAGNDDKLVEE